MKGNSNSRLHVRHCYVSGTYTYILTNTNIQGTTVAYCTALQSDVTAISHNMASIFTKRMVQ